MHLWPRFLASPLLPWTTELTSLQVFLPLDPPHSSSLLTSEPPSSPWSATPTFPFHHLTFEKTRLRRHMACTRWWDLSDSTSVPSQGSWLQLLPGKQSITVSIACFFLLWFLPVLIGFIAPASFIHSFTLRTIFYLRKFSHWRMCQQILFCNAQPWLGHSTFPLSPIICKGHVGVP